MDRSDRPIATPRRYNSRPECLARKSRSSNARRIKDPKRILSMGRSALGPARNLCQNSSVHDVDCGESAATCMNKISRADRVKNKRDDGIMLCLRMSFSIRGTFDCLALCCVAFASWLAARVVPSWSTVHGQLPFVKQNQLEPET